MSRLTAVAGPNPTSGHGECFIWENNENSTIAVDAGGSKKVGRYAGQQAPEILILSHDDSDHINGAVELIHTATASLSELWVPAEWYILIQQIAATDAENLIPPDNQRIVLSSVEALIIQQFASIDGFIDDNGEVLLTLVEEARANILAWDRVPISEDAGFFIRLTDSSRTHWYGATDLAEIIDRVKARATALLDILDAAHTHKIKIRFFSVDVPFSQITPPWMTAGRPGTATMANAFEAPLTPLNAVPPGLPHSLALTRLTVQNRRALCTLLWNDSTTPKYGGLIWSDTDGNWLDHACNLGFDQIVNALSASSAPHHASDNPAHDRVWDELRLASDSLLMISAGGQWNQNYRAEYLAKQTFKSCTKCRPTARTYQDVSITIGTSISLSRPCIVHH